MSDIEKFLRHLYEVYELSKDETDAILSHNPDSIKKISTEKLLAIYGEIIEKAFEKLEDSCYEYYTYFDEYGQEIDQYELDEECLKRNLPVKVKTLVSYLDDNMKALEKAIRDILMSNSIDRKMLKSLIADKKVHINRRIKLMLKENEYEYELADMDYLSIDMDTLNTSFINLDKIDIKGYLDHMLKFFKNEYEPEIVAMVKTSMGIHAKIISDYNGIVESVLRELEKELDASILVSNDEEEEEIMMEVIKDIRRYRDKYIDIISVMVKERLWRELKTATPIAEISVVKFIYRDPEPREYIAWVVWKPHKSSETTA
jgi:hypothetical protein